MEQWRDLFAKAGADIWTVIEQAIILAATDYPTEFKDKRSHIAETLFAPMPFQLRSTDTCRPSGSVVTYATNLVKEENEVRDDEEGTEHPTLAFSGRTDSWHHCCYDEAEALTDEMEEESLLMKELY